MDFPGLNWHWAGALSLVVGMPLNLAFTMVLNWHTKMLMPIPVTRRKRVFNDLHRRRI